MSFPAYDDYMESSVEWLTEIPRNWDVVPIKRVGRLKGGAGFPHADQGVEGELLDFHKVNALSRADADGYLAPSDNTISPDTASRLGAFVFPPETIVFAKVGAALLLSRIRIIGNDSCIDNNMMGLIVHQELFDVTFIRYAMELVRFDLIANPGAVPSLNEGQIGNFRLPTPTDIDEQKTIANFLDAETSKIDALVAEQRRLIELLKEKRQAVISHAVTKGLNPNAPMKDSGIEWLGEVPEHWEVKKFKHLLSMIVDNRGRTPQFGDEGVPMLEAKQITEGTRHPSRSFIKFVPREVVDQFERDKVCEGDVLITTVGATAGRAVLVDASPDYFIAQNVIGMRPKSEVLPDYLFYLVISDFFYSSLMMTNKSNTIDNLKVSVFINNYCTLPPKEEQAPIVEYLNEHLETFTQLQAEAKGAIELLQERRTALISAAVTGKIDVREYATQETT